MCLHKQRIQHFWLFTQYYPYIYHISYSFSVGCLAFSGLLVVRKFARDDANALSGPQLHVLLDEVLNIIKLYPFGVAYFSVM